MNYYMIEGERIWCISEGRFVDTVPESEVVDALFAGDSLMGIDAFVNWLAARGHSLGELTPIEERVAILQQQFDTNITAKLNAFVATRQYGSLDTCVGRYLNCSIEAFTIEAAYVQDMNARIWVWAGAYLNAVMAGQKPIPTWEEFEAEMDAIFPLEWPIADIREQ